MDNFYNLLLSEGLRYPNHGSLVRIEEHPFHGETGEAVAWHYTFADGSESMSILSYQLAYRLGCDMNPAIEFSSEFREGPSLPFRVQGTRGPENEGQGWLKFDGE